MVSFLKSFFFIVICVFVPGDLFAHEPAFPFKRRIEVERTVYVPLDWGNPKNSELIEISYRILNPDALEKPLVVFFNGGPGGTSEAYVERNNESQMAGLRKYFRILIMDPRGFGRSAPVDASQPALTSQMMSLFRSEYVARDIEFILKKELSKSEAYYVFAHSFGGITATYFLDHIADSTELRPPSGVVMASTILPFTTPEHFLYRRFQQQILLNRKFLSSRPDIRAKMLAARKKIQNLNYVGPTGAKLVAEDFDFQIFNLVTPQALERLADTILDPKTTGEMIESRTQGIRNTSVDSLQGLISALDVTKGKTDYEMMKKLEGAVSQLPPWMMLEARGILSLGDLTRLGNVGKFNRQAEWASVYKQLPKRSPSLKRVRKTVEDSWVIFLAGEHDAFIPGIRTYEQEALRWGKSPKHFAEIIEEANHYVSYNATWVADWLAETMNVPRDCESKLDH